jgi:hypothetical protein
MEFPNVPFDENLFESNQMMKDYWNRSTSGRQIEYAHDVVHEETNLPEDGEAAVYQELRQLSEQSYRPEGGHDYVSRPSEPLPDVFMSAEGAIVRPKAREASGPNSFIVAGVAVAVLVVVLFFGARMGGTKEAARVSPRGSASRSRRV